MIMEATKPLSKRYSNFPFSNIYYWGLCLNSFTCIDRYVLLELEPEANTDRIKLFVTVHDSNGEPIQHLHHVREFSHYYSNAHWDQTYEKVPLT